MRRNLTTRSQAMRYFLRAMMLGAPWVVYDDVTQSLRVLYVTEGVNTSFSEAWTMFEEWSSDKIISAASKRQRELEVVRTLKHHHAMPQNQGTSRSGRV